MLAHGSEAGFDVPSAQWLCKDVHGEYTRLIRNNVLGISVFLDGAFQSQQSDIAAPVKRYLIITGFTWPCPAELSDAGNTPSLRS